MPKSSTSSGKKWKTGTPTVIRPPRNWAALSVLVVLISCVSARASVSPKELRDRIDGWKYADWHGFPDSLTGDGGVEPGDLVPLITPGQPQDWRFLEKALYVLQKLDRPDKAALVKTRALLEGMEKSELTERIEAQATDYYLKFADYPDAAAFVTAAMPTLRPRALIRVMNWIDASSVSQPDRVAILKMGRAALQRFGVLAETERFHNEATEASPVMMFTLADIFLKRVPDGQPFFALGEFAELKADAFTRALAHPRQLNHWGVSTLLSILGKVGDADSPKLETALKDRIASSTDPQRRMLLYFVFSAKWQHTGHGKNLIAWINEKHPALVGLWDQLAKSEINDGKVSGPAEDAIRAAYRELGMQLYW